MTGLVARQVKIGLDLVGCGREKFGLYGYIVPVYHPSVYGVKYFFACQALPCNDSLKHGLESKTVRAAAVEVFALWWLRPEPRPTSKDVSLSCSVVRYSEPLYQQYSHRLKAQRHNTKTTIVTQAGTADARVRSNPKALLR